MEKGTLCGLTLRELTDFTSRAGVSDIHNHAILTNIYKKRIFNAEDFIKIPKKYKELLMAAFLPGISSPALAGESTDKSKKFLFSSEDGRSYETVFIPEENRSTVCVSVQAGCRMACSFCATASYGFRGKLSVSEIINQIISLPEADKVTHVVFMGMGEPLDNLDNVLTVCEILTSSWGLSISPRNITVSTVGILNGVDRFLMESACNLTISLHSPFPEERMKIIPVEKIWPVHEIIRLIKSRSLRKNQRITAAYVMIKGLNDTDRHLRALIELLKDSSIRVNLLPFHRSGSNDFESSDHDRMQNFRHNLVISGISASIRKSRGEDISAACGLLASGLKR